MEEDTFIIGKPELRSCISHFSVDAESGYEDGVSSDLNDVTENISDLTLDSDTRYKDRINDGTQ